MSSLPKISPKGAAETAGPIRASALCLTGGGMLGRYTAEILTALAMMREEVVGTTISQGRKNSELRYAFDVVAGTSVGALLAGGLAAGVHPQHMADTMEKFGERIFPEKSDLSRLSHTKTAWFDNAPLVEAVEETLGGKKDYKLGNLDTHLAIPALNESTGEPIIFSTLNAAHLEINLKDAVLASAAAPLYLPAWLMQGERYVDGGLFANAPDISAIRILQQSAPNLKLENISVVSIGTTDADRKSPVEKSEAGNWGLKRWLASPVPARLLKLILAAQTAHDIELIRTLPLDNYERLDTNLNDVDASFLALDNASSVAMSKLKELAQVEMSSLSKDRRDRLRILVGKTPNPSNPPFERI